MEKVSAESQHGRLAVDIVPIVSIGFRFFFAVIEPGCKIHRIPITFDKEIFFVDFRTAVEYLGEGIAVCKCISAYCFDSAAKHHRSQVAVPVAYISMPKFLRKSINHTPLSY